uniref:Major facilitator superfamily (MFS) profile domain-containing protein n=1 Tax=Proboscia inermis TaxID=420281 RepID=A0A7S0C1T6_9STRA|mmetsp:Transcript_21993/g.22313  ORF Transcript_21993/g.22313 Transcript_21993/m.22313 type:complete len:452 (+) Transcript_21993:156-1511(+)
MMQLINSFGVYLAAFLMRPLGAILFGEMGDRVVGRKNALVMSILLITIPSVAMGLLPTYEMIGPIAPILLVILRMMQGLSVGGQLAGSYVLSIEQSTTLNRGFRGSICDASSVGGFLLASLVTTSVRSVFSAETVIAWAWRVPFWFSLALAPLLYHIVSHTEESKFWEERKDQEKAEKIVREEEEVQTPAFIDLFSSPFRRRQLAGMIGVLSAVSSSFYMLFLWTPLYLSNLRGLVSEQFADFMTVLVVSTYIVTLIFMGKLSDKFPHRMDLIRIGLPGIIVAAPVMFTMFESDSILGIFIGQIQFAICLAVVQGGMAAWEVELWMADPSLSFTGVAIGHNLASTIFGGTMPLVATALFYKSVEISSGEEDLFDLISHSLPALYLSFLGCVSLTSLSFVVRHPHDVRTGEKKIRNAMSLERKRARARIRKDTAALEESGASSGGFFSFFKK